VDIMVLGIVVAIFGGLISAFGEPLGNSAQVLVQRLLQ